MPPSPSGIIKGIKRSLTRTLILWILVFSGLITFLMVGVQLYNEYRLELKGIDKSFSQITNGFIPSLEQALWNFDTNQIHFLLDGILALGEVTYLELEGPDIGPIHKGVRSQIGSEVIFSKKLHFGAEETLLGELKLYSDLELVMNKLMNKLALIFATQFIKTCLVTAFLYLIFSKLVTRPLSEIFDNLRAIEREGVVKAPNLMLRPASAPEFHRTAQVINEMKGAIAKSYSLLEVKKEELETQQRELESYKNRLEELVSKKTQQYHEAMESAERANRAKSTFISNMSHELRTPLNSIILLSSLLRKNRSENLSSDDVYKAEIINSAGNDLLSLINEILDLSKIEANKMALVAEKIDLKEQLEYIAAMFGPEVEAKGLVLKLELNSPILFYTDRTKLSQIVKNLLSNAIKFTSKGEVTLALTGDSQVASIEVRDTGRGIAAAKVETIFNRFEQGDESILDSQGGTGLGLYISRALATLLKGKLSAESTLGFGSRFKLTLTSLSDSESASSSAFEEKERDEAVQVSEVGMTLKDKHFMIADDDDRNLFSLQEVLLDCGAKVDLYRDGVELLQGLDEGKKPHFIVLDMMMPRGGGLEVMRVLKSRPEWIRLPVIVLTASVDQELKQKAMSLGARAYLHKPVRLRELEAEVSKIMS